VDRDAVQAGSRAEQEPSQLLSVPDRVQPAHGQAVENLEQWPGAGRDDEAPRAQVGREGVRHTLRQVPSPSLQVDHQLRLRVRGCQQLVEQQTRPPGWGECPPVPIDRQRPEGLEVAYLEPAAEEVDVSLDEREAGGFGLAEQVESVAGPVDDDERRCRAGRSSHTRSVRH
jgi:hypothetical protein